MDFVVCMDICGTYYRLYGLYGYLIVACIMDFMVFVMVLLNYGYIIVLLWSDLNFNYILFHLVRFEFKFIFFLF